MSIEVRIVSDEQGYIGHVNSEGQEILAGTIQFKDLYTFYVQRNAVAQTKDDRYPHSAVHNGLEAKMILPLGGTTSGLYRFPRVGEKVLLELGAGGENYLLGYVPSEEDAENTIIPNYEAKDFTKDKKIDELGKEIDKLLEKRELFEKQAAQQYPENKKKEILAGIDAEIAELKHEKELREARYKNLSQSTSDKERNDLLSQGMGMSLRYRQTGKQQGKTTAGEKYSEIGFYRQETSWKAKTAVKDDYNDPEKNGYPNIDTIKINSTGDINSDARNYYRTKAKRFELLVDCDEVDHKIYDKDDPECDIIAMKDQEQPFGDRPGDDSFVYAGDAHIRAKNRIIIKAGTEIRLEVGRSSIIINESGIILAARKTTSNIMNSWDTIINMDHRSGLLMFGQHVKIDSGTDFAITEGFGGSIGSSAGVMRISAKDLLAKTFGTFNYIMRGSAVGADMAGNIASMGAGIGGADNSMDAVNSFGTNVRIITGITGGILGDRMAASYSDGVDNIGTIAKLLTLIYSILKLVWMTIELTIPVEKQKKGGRDGLSMAASIFEYGIAMAAFIQISVKNLPAAIHSNTLQLGADASLTVYTKTFHTYHLNSENVDGPLNGVDSGEFKENLKDGLKKFWQETLPKWYVLLGAGIGAGVYAGAIGLTKGFATSKQDEEYREELMAL